METLTYAAPGLLFPAIAALMLAYNNRFVGLASLVRQLVASNRGRDDARIRGQVDNLRVRISLLRHSQALGTLSLVLGTICMFLLFLRLQHAAQLAFAAALVLMLASLACSLREIYLSVRALNIELDAA